MIRIFWVVGTLLFLTAISATSTPVGPVESGVLPDDHASIQQETKKGNPTPAEGEEKSFIVEFPRPHAKKEAASGASLPESPQSGARPPSYVSWEKGHVHNCIHDTPFIQRSYFDGMDKVVPVKTLRRGYDEQAVNPIRIKFFTEDLYNSSKYCTSSSGTNPDMKGGTISCSADMILTTAIRDAIINAIMPLAVSRLTAALRVESVAENLVAGAGACSEFTKPAGHTSTGVSDVDMILYVAGAPTSGGAAAFAGHCQEAGSGRPTVGHVNFGPKYNDWGTATESERAGMLDTAVHEILHALGITNSKFGSKSTIGVRGKAGITIVGSTQVTAKARTFFNCSSLAGVELEDEGSSGSAGSHWERRLFRDEVMAASSGGSLSAITLGALEDQGYYTPDYSVAEDMNFGKNGGCSFISEKCDTTGGGKDTFFCFAANAEACTLDHAASGKCAVYNSTSDLPSYFQYFAGLPKQGGGTFMDGCPVFEGYSTGICQDYRDLTANDNVYGYYWGNGSRCFDTTGTYGLIQSGYGGSGSKARCIQASCPGGSRIEFRVGGANTEWQQCPLDGTAGSVSAPSGFSGAITCPTAAEFCDGNISSTGGAVPTPAPTPVTTATGHAASTSGTSASATSAGTPQEATHTTTTTQGVVGTAPVATTVGTATTTVAAATTVPTVPSAGTTEGNTGSESGAALPAHYSAPIILGLTAILSAAWGA